MERFIEFISNHPFLFGALFITLIMIIFTEFQRHFRGFKEVSPLQATQMQSHNDAIFLDIRDIGEYRQGHVLGAKHIPLKELVRRTGELKKYSDHPIIAYCANGNRSGQACSILKKEGFTSLFDLSGGLNAWERANLPLVKK